MMGAIIYLVLPRDAWVGRSESSRLEQTLLVLGGVRNAILYLVVLGLAMAYLVVGNGLGRVIGAVLLGALGVVTIRLALKRRA